MLSELHSSGWLMWYLLWWWEKVSGLELEIMRENSSLSIDWLCDLEQVDTLSELYFSLLTYMVNKIKSEADIKNDTIEVQNIRRDYYKQFNNTGSLEEMNKFIEIYNPL